MTDRMCQTPQCTRPARERRYRCAFCTNEKQRTGHYPVLLPPPTPCKPTEAQPDYLFRDELVKALERVDNLERVHLT